MIIITQNGQIINFDNVVSIQRFEKRIIAFIVDKREVVLANFKFKDIKRAEKLQEEIQDLLLKGEHVNIPILLLATLGGE